MPATVATPNETVVQAFRQLENDGTIVISCSREDLLCLLARQILKNTVPHFIVRRGKVVRLWPNDADIDQFRTLAELVLLYFEE